MNEPVQVILFGEPCDHSLFMEVQTLLKVFRTPDVKDVAALIG